MTEEESVAGENGGTDNNDMSGTPIGEEKGKEILAWAMNQDYCVLEFTQMDDGTYRVMPITDHVQMLEDKYVEDMNARTE